MRPVASICLELQSDPKLPSQMLRPIIFTMANHLSCTIATTANSIQLLHVHALIYSVTLKHKPLAKCCTPTSGSSCVQHQSTQPKYAAFTGATCLSFYVDSVVCCNSKAECVLHCNYSVNVRVNPIQHFWSVALSPRNGLHLPLLPKSHALLPLSLTSHLLNIVLLQECPLMFSFDIPLVLN